jgi:ribosomal protein L32
MPLEFFTVRHLLVFRDWRTSDVRRLFGKPDAIFALPRYRYHVRSRPRRTKEELLHCLVTGHRPAFLRARVEAVEQRDDFRPDEDRIVDRMKNWSRLREACHDALDTVASRAFGSTPTVEEAPITEPLFRLDDSNQVRCDTCGAISFNHRLCQSYGYEGYLPPARPQPWRIEQTPQGYQVVDADGLLVVHLFHAKWALPLAIALTGQRLFGFEGALAQEPEEAGGAGRSEGSRPPLRVVPETGI